MLFLSFMRHAKSDWNNYNGNDISRPISKKGIKKSKLVSKHLERNKINFDLVYCSPSVRTIQTLNCLLRNHSFGKPEIIEDYNIYEGSGEQFLIKLSKLENFTNVLVISHEPQISFFVDFFFKGRNYEPEIDNIRFVTSSIITLKFDTSSWENISNLSAKFVRFIDPNLL